MDGYKTQRKGQPKQGRTREYRRGGDKTHFQDAAQRRSIRWETIGHAALISGHLGLTQPNDSERACNGCSRPCKTNSQARGGESLLGF